MIRVCTCGNPQFGFDCTCEWSRKNQGDRLFNCEFCGIYEASKARCNHCQEEIREKKDGGLEVIVKNL